MQRSVEADSASTLSAAKQLVPRTRAEPLDGRKTRGKTMSSVHHGVVAMRSAVRRLVPRTRAEASNGKKIRQKTISFAHCKVVSMRSAVHIANAAVIWTTGGWAAIALLPSMVPGAM
eukprot:GEMP01145223.1.p4 GENE.GEMP01145223.1~~GEMP01145223.1.p4  ORF type:complete len:117 (+),score=19.74 GEMP01145223.1:85-435(+)